MDAVCGTLCQSTDFLHSFPEWGRDKTCTCTEWPSLAIAAKCLLVLVGLGEGGEQHCWNSVIRKSRLLKGIVLNWMAVPESDNIKNCKGCCCFAPVFIYLITWCKEVLEDQKNTSPWSYCVGKKSNQKPLVFMPDDIFDIICVIQLRYLSIAGPLPHMASRGKKRRVPPTCSQSDVGW